MAVALQAAGQGQLEEADLDRAGRQAGGSRQLVHVGRGAPEGLKEALRVGTEATISLTGKTDGYFANQAIKILLPAQLQTADKESLQLLEQFG